uniref:Peroxisomal biogenesis factor 19 n=1 Tax=Arundo donax TaxID=35708 RepID=A0A0A9D4A9_ARUDO
MRSSCFSYCSYYSILNLSLFAPNHLAYCPIYCIKGSRTKSLERTCGGRCQYLDHALHWILA